MTDLCKTIVLWAPTSQNFFNYRRQRSCEGYVFTPVSHSVYGGVCLSACWDTTPPGSRPLWGRLPQSRHPSPHEQPPQEQTPPGTRHPLEQTSPWDQAPQGADTPPPRTRHPPPPASRQLLLQMVRILLECILVSIIFGDLCQKMGSPYHYIEYCSDMITVKITAATSFTPCRNFSNFFLKMKISVISIQSLVWVSMRIFFTWENIL